MPVHFIRTFTKICLMEIIRQLEFSLFLEICVDYDSWTVELAKSSAWKIELRLVNSRKGYGGWERIIATLWEGSDLTWDNSLGDYRARFEPTTQLGLWSTTYRWMYELVFTQAWNIPSVPTSFCTTEYKGKTTFCTTISLFCFALPYINHQPLYYSLYFDSK